MSKIIENAINDVDDHIRTTIKNMVTELGTTISNSATDVLQGSVSILSVKQNIVNKWNSLMNDGLDAVTLTKDIIMSSA